MKLHSKLKALFAAIVEEANNNQQFAGRLEQVLGIGQPKKANALKARSRRRQPAIVDPFIEFGRGEAALRERLKQLTIEQLRDVVAEYRMDQARLAMKWKDSSRLVELIVSMVGNRLTKGDAFRAQNVANPPPSLNNLP
jgi:hypothetical protein